MDTALSLLLEEVVTVSSFLSATSGVSSDASCLTHTSRLHGVLLVQSVIEEVSII